MLAQMRKTVLWISLLTVGTGAIVSTPRAAAEEETKRKVTKRVKPAYPSIARQMRLAGTVKMVLLVAPDGKVKSIKTTGGHPVLVAAAEDAARQWTFESAPKESSESLSFDFASPD